VKNVKCAVNKKRKKDVLHLCFHVHVYVTRAYRIT